MKTEKFGGKRSMSDMAAYSLQAGMNLKQLQSLAKKVGAEINKEELTQIREVRQILKSQRSAALGF